MSASHDNSDVIHGYNIAPYNPAEWGQRPVINSSTTRAPFGPDGFIAPTGFPSMEPSSLTAPYPAWSQQPDLPQFTNVREGSNWSLHSHASQGLTATTTTNTNLVDDGRESTTFSATSVSESQLEFVQDMQSMAVSSANGLQAGGSTTTNVSPADLSTLVATIVARCSVKFRPHQQPVAFTDVVDHYRRLRMQGGPSWNQLDRWMQNDFRDFDDHESIFPETCTMFQEDFIPDEWIAHFPPFDSLSPLAFYYLTFCVIMTDAAELDPWSAQLLMINMLSSPETLRAVSSEYLKHVLQQPVAPTSLFVGGGFREFFLGCLTSIRDGVMDQPLTVTRLPEVLSFLFSFTQQQDHRWVLFFEQVENLESFRQALPRDTAAFAQLAEPLQNLMRIFLSIIHKEELPRCFVTTPCAHAIFQCFTSFFADHAEAKYFGRPRPIRLSLAAIQADPILLRAFKAHEENNSPIF